MTSTNCLLLAATAFVGTHFLMSHPLRRPMIDKLGQKGFLGIYTLVSFATLGAMIWAAWHTEPAAPLWDAGKSGLIAANLLMWLGAILFAGSHKGNPAMPNPGAPVRSIPDPWGVFRITRHPMMWGFGLWGLTHAIVNPTPPGLIVSGAIFILAIGGSAMQDRRKEQEMAEAWPSWEARTSFLPFGRGLVWPGTTAVVAGTLFFLVASWAHGALGYRMAGPWAF